MFGRRSCKPSGIPAASARSRMIDPILKSVVSKIFFPCLREVRLVCRI